MRALYRPSRAGGAARRRGDANALRGLRGRQARAGVAVTQIPMPLSLADRVRAWAERHDGARFAELCDAMGEGATEADAAARGGAAL